MSMGTYVVALRDMDGEFKRMIAAKRFCDENKFSYPEEVDLYFQRKTSWSEKYLYEEFHQVDIEDILKEYSDGSSWGYELDLSQLPEEVKTLRFYNSY